MKKILILQKKVLRIILTLTNTDSVSDGFREMQIMPIKMLFDYSFSMYFIKTFRDNIDNLSIKYI